MDWGDAAAFAAGLILKDGTALKPADLELLPGDFCRVTVTEGKYHQIKRMTAARGKRVLSLERVSVGALTIPSALDRGGYVRLTKEEADGVFAVTDKMER
jgi:16S rRNA pseudouridine516 synthase